MPVKKVLNTIATKQNQPAAIAKLAAVKILYRRAKRIFYTQGILAIGVALVFPYLGQVFPTWQPELTVIVITYFFIQILVLHTVESRCRETAAGIQELFDTEVLDISWNAIVIGKKPSERLIQKNAKQVAKKAYAKLLDWYPPAVAMLPASLAKTVCQRANVWWDSRLRRGLSAGLAILAAGLLALLVIERQHVESYLPLFELLVQQMIAHHESARRLDHLGQRLDGLLTEAATRPNRSISATTTRSIQDEIYHHRTTAQTIPTWLYKALRPYFEKSMNFDAEAYIMGVLASRKRFDKG